MYLAVHRFYYNTAEAKRTREKSSQLACACVLVSAYDLWLVVTA